MTALRQFLRPRTYLMLSLGADKGRRINLAERSFLTLRLRGYALRVRRLDRIAGLLAGVYALGMALWTSSRENIR